MTMQRTPQCDKITCKAFGMGRETVPVSGPGHALVDLAGAAKRKFHGDVAGSKSRQKRTQNPEDSRISEAGALDT